MITKSEVVNRYLPSQLEPLESVQVFAPSNIALCKYWGKRDTELNLPINSSLSVSLGHLGTHTTLKLSESGQDIVILNNKLLSISDPFSQKVIQFIDLFRRTQAIPLIIDTRNNIPTAAGLASSASGFAALTKAVDRFFSLGLDPLILSAFARMGSGSASRSLYKGFVAWHMGIQDDGMDSIASPILTSWPNLCVGLIKVSNAQKAVDSRTGMQRTVMTSQLYQSWPAQAAADFTMLQQVIAEGDFNQLGACAEKNAMSMHATMASAWPPLVYWLPESVTVMHKVWALRNAGINVYFTMDAGPNLKLLFEDQDSAVLKTEFPEMEIVKPFEQ